MASRSESRISARQHYELERALADRLRAADKQQRQVLYCEVYDELYTRLYDLGLLEGVRRNNSRQLELLCSLLHPFLVGVTSFVEFGSGDGALSNAVAETHRNLEMVIAIDASTMPGGSRTPKRKRITHLTPNEAACEVRASSIDFVFSCHFVEHLHPDDINDHLTGVRRILKPNGRYLVITPNILLGPHDVSRDFDPVATGLHLQEYTYRSLADCLRQAGFSTVKALQGSSAPFHFVPLRAVTTAEAGATLLPVVLRRAVLRALGRPQPFRALEQVKLLASI